MKSIPIRSGDGQGGPAFEDWRYLHFEGSDAKSGDPKDANGHRMQFRFVDRSGTKDYQLEVPTAEPPK